MGWHWIGACSASVARDSDMHTDGSPVRAGTISSIAPQDIVQVAAACGLTVHLRAEQPATWADTLLTCAYVPVSHSNASIDYQLAYQRGHGGRWDDLSLAIQWDNRFAALWPLSLAEKDGQAILSSQGLPVLPPVFAADVPVSIRKQIAAGCLSTADTIAGAAGLTSWESAESFNDTVGLSDWHARSMANGARCTLAHELYLDLRPEMTEIKRNVRKSYKSLITSGMRIWSVGVLSVANESVWNEFHQLHANVSGRQTRSDETWNLQLGDVGNGRAFLVHLRNDVGEMVGGGLFNFTRDEGVYAVAAYNRSLFDKPLGHVVQYRAIQELKSRGTRWYKIGVRRYRSEVPAPPEKEVTISEFKQGFASHLMPQFRLMHEVRVGKAD